MCIHVETVTEEVVYEVVVAEPHDQAEQAQKEGSKDSGQGPADLSAKQQPEGKLQYITPNLNLCNVYNEVIVH